MSRIMNVREHKRGRENINYVGFTILIL